MSDVKVQSVTDAARALLEAVPPYAGLAVYLTGEREAFHEAEWKVVQAMDALRDALAAEEQA